VLKGRLVGGNSQTLVIVVGGQSKSGQASRTAGSVWPELQYNKTEFFQKSSALFQHALLALLLVSSNEGLMLSRVHGRVIDIFICKIICQLRHLLAIWE
jgi:hypothetical protein